MSLHNLGQMGAIGEIMALFGAAILWTFRAQAFEWLREFFDIWRGQISGRDPLLSDPLYHRARPRRPRGALLLVGALALVFIGQVLFLLDLTL
ncbi:MAG: hypothetical protein JWN92_1699 [Candidatus Acidoferrum typicum]|jgi:hypothetical protein|nr:hypothetical protein [Candidatus Acidoferrum typicum]